VAGGGIGGSALFRYLAEAGMRPVMINFGRGASWRNIAGGRPAFSLPEIADIAGHNLEIFKELQQIHNIDFHQTRYVTFAHDDETLKTCEDSMLWSDAYMVDPKDFQREISPFMNADLNKYRAALITENCWQASPGKVVDLIRRIGIDNGGYILEDCNLVSVEKDGPTYKVIIRDHDKQYTEYHTGVFINALGAEADKFARMTGVESGLYAVKHQAFITRRLPMMGMNGKPLDMLIDRRKYKGFSAVYGQQLAETGQIIGCASPAFDPQEAEKNLKINSERFLEIADEIFVDWIPQLSSVGFQAVWAGYYVEPRMIIDPQLGLFIGLRGHGFMLGQYLAKLYVESITGKNTPPYFERLAFTGDGLPEKAFK
jgi:glycine/D-amino acid oxidase-like deaminating enzyme